MSYPVKCNEFLLQKCFISCRSTLTLGNALNVTAELRTFFSEAEKKT